MSINYRNEALLILGRGCAFCGDLKEERLQIDHVQNDGKVDRKYSGQAETTARQKFYRRIVKDGIKARRYARVLCSRCNEPKEKTRKILERYDDIRCLLWDELEIDEPGRQVINQLIMAYHNLDERGWSLINEHQG